MRDSIFPPEPMQLGEYVFREGGPADRDGILASFNRVFSEDHPGFVPRTPEEWNWAYEQNPAGRQICVAVNPAGVVCSHFAGLPIRMNLAGRPATFCQIVDAFTHPEHRKGLKKPGLFVQTAHAFIDHWVWPHRDVALYGIPIPSHHRLGTRYIGYEVVRTQLALSLRTEDTLTGGETALPVREIPRVDARVDALFDRSLSPSDAMALRDEAFMNWRYAHHPHRRYRLAVVEDGAAWRGLAVFSDDLFSDLHQGLLVDWLVPPDDDEAARALIQWARNLSREQRRPYLTGIFAGTDPWWQPLQSMGFRALKTKYVLVYGNLEREPSIQEDWLRAHWRYRLGDMDVA